MSVPFEPIVPPPSVPPLNPPPDPDRMPGEPLPDPEPDEGPAPRLKADHCAMGTALQRRPPTDGGRA